MIRLGGQNQDVSSPGVSARNKIFSAHVHIMQGAKIDNVFNSFFYTSFSKNKFMPHLGGPNIHTRSVVI